MNQGENAHPVRAEISATPSSPLGLSESTIAKLAEYGGFTVSILVLCLFFWILTQFVKQVKED